MDFASLTVLNELEEYPTGLLNHKPKDVDLYWSYDIESPTAVTDSNLDNSIPQAMGKNETAVEVASESDLARVFRLYSISDIHSVKSYLSSNQFLVALLVDAQFAINKHFKDAVVSLVVVEDREIENRAVLNAVIDPPDRCTSVNVASDNFDRGWWFKAMSRARGKLSIDLR